MRIQPHDVNQAKAAAKRLQDISENGAPGTVRLARSRALEAVAHMLGFKHWHELLSTKAPPAPWDHDVPSAERRERRRQQAAVLEALGFSPSAAAATIEVVLPSGRFEAEVIQAQDYITRAAVAANHLPNAVQADVAWLIHNLGLDASADAAWAEEAAKVRHAIDGGIVHAAHRHIEGLRARTGERKGWFGVILERDDFYQGYYLAQPDPDLVTEAERQLRDFLKSKTSDIQGVISLFQGMIESGFTAMPGSYSGALQAIICELASKGPEALNQIALFGWLLHREIGLDHFAVIMRGRTSGGVLTEVKPLAAANVAAARAEFEALPENAAIRKRLIERLGGPNF